MSQADFNANFHLSDIFMDTEGTTNLTTETPPMTQAQYFASVQNLLPNGLLGNFNTSYANYGTSGHNQYNLESWSNGLLAPNLLSGLNTLLGSTSSLPPGVSPPVISSDGDGNYYNYSNGKSTAASDSQITKNLISEYARNYRSNYITSPYDPNGNPIYVDGKPVTQAQIDQSTAQFNADAEKYAQMGLSNFKVRNAVYQTYVNALNAYGAKYGISQGDRNNLLGDVSKALLGNGSISRTIPSNESILNSVIMGFVFSKIGAEPQTYGITSDKFSAFMASFAKTGSPITDSSQTKLPDTLFDSFISSVNAFVSTSTNALNGNSSITTNPLDGFLNTLYHDTISPTVIQSAIEVNFLNPKHANMPPPNYQYLDQTLNVDLNSTANKALYQQIVQQYTKQYNLSPEQLRRINVVHNDPTFNDPWAQQMSLKIMATQLAQLAESGEINITQTMYGSLLAQLPPDVQNALTEFQTNAQSEKGVKFYGAQLSLEQLTAVLGALMIAGNATVDAAKSEAARIGLLNQSTQVAGVFVLGASTALEKLIHPNTVNLLDFLGVVAKFVLEYRNELMKVMVADGKISSTQNIAKRSAIDDQLTQLQKLIEQHKEMYKAQDDQKLVNNAVGGTLIGAGGALVGTGIGLMILGIILTILTLGMGAPATSPLIGAGAAMIGAGVGAMAGGVMMVLQAHGINIGKAIMDAIKDDIGKDALMGAMIAITLLSVILTVLTMGSTSALTAGLGAAGGSIVSVVTTEIWGNRLQEILVKALTDSGQSDSEATVNASVVIAMINVAMVLLTLGGVAAQSFASSGGNLMAEFTTNAQGAAIKQTSSAALATRSFMQTFQSALGSLAKGVTDISMSSILKAFTALGKALGKILSNFKAAFGEGMTAALTIAEAIQQFAQGVASIVQGTISQKMAQNLEVQALIDQTVALLNMAIQLLDTSTSNLQQNQSSMMTQATELSESFQEMVQDLMQAVTAITSNSAAPTAAATGGGGAPPKDNKVDKSPPADPSQGVPTQVFIASPFNAASQPTPDEGYETSFMGVAKLQNSIAMLLLLRSVGQKLSEMFQKMGSQSPQEEGMQMASLLLKQLGMLAAGTMDSSSKGQEALAKNPMLLTLQLLLTKKGVNPEEFDIQALMNVSQSGDLDGATLEEIVKMLEKLAATNPELQELLANLKKITNRKSGTSQELSFEILELFAGGEKGIEAELLKDLLGDDADTNTMQLLDSGGQELGSLIDEYFIRGSSSGSYSSEGSRA